MPSRPGWRQLAVRRRDVQNEDDPADDAAPLDEVWASEAKRARRQQRTRKALETAIDAVQEVFNWWP